MTTSTGSLSTSPPIIRATDADIVRDALIQDPDTIISKPGGIDITVRSLRKLVGKGWLFCDTVEAYMRMFAETDKSIGVMGTFLWTQLSTKGPKYAISRNRKTIEDLKTKNLILIPINLAEDQHWIMAAVYLRSQEIHIYDSCVDTNRTGVGNVLKEFFLMNGLFRHCEVVFEQKTSIPRQTNSYDCGAFVCRFARCLILDIKMDFTEEEMPEIRRKLLHELITARPLPRTDAEKTFVEIIMEVEELCKTSTLSLEKTQETMEVDSSSGIKAEQNEEPFSTIQGIQINLENNERFDDDEAKQASSSRLYQATPLELDTLRRGEVPFVDIDRDGKEFTANTGGDWKKMLKLSEILSSLSADKQEAWRILFEKLEEDPGTALKWFRNSGKEKEKPTPFQFRFGRLNNIQKIKKFIEQAYPCVKIEGLHESSIRKK